MNIGNLLNLVKAYASPSDKEGPTIKTPLGSVQGRYIKSYEGRTVSTFEGIPYATPPVGKLRFRVYCLTLTRLNLIII